MLRWFLRSRLNPNNLLQVVHAYRRLSTFLATALAVAIPTSVLDVSLFSPLAIYYSQGLNQHLCDSQGISAISKRDFFRLFWPAFLQAFTEHNILSSWSKTGISPFNPAVVTDSLTKPFTKEQGHQSRPGSSGASSTISASDWRKVRQIMKETIADASKNEHPDYQKLSNALCHITTENALLKAENKGFKTALYNEKKKRKRGKQLFEEFRQHEGQGAVFFSPQKIQAAVDLQARREEEKAAQKEAKAIEAEEKKAEKERQRLLMEQRKQERIEQRAEKAEAAAKKRAEKVQAREMKEASKQLQETLQAPVRQQSYQSSKTPWC